MISNGTLDGLIYYDSRITDAISECKKNATLTCTNGYHVEKNDVTGEQSCEENIKICDCQPNSHATKCQATYDTSNNEWGACTPITCELNFILIDGSCTDSSQACTKLTGCNSEISGSEISGNAATTPSGNTEYTGCICTSQINNFLNGTAKKACPHGKNKDDGWLTTCEIIVTSCEAGFCEQNKACLAAPIGTYSGAGETLCNECPNASTTMDVGSTNITDCAYKRGNDGTKFCDKYGCFYLKTLPDTDGTDNKARQYIMYKN